MVRYLIDANLPFYFSLWSTPNYEHVNNLNDEWNDSQIWNYAKTNNQTIITKDADFSERIMLNNAPPQVIHIRFGNMKMAEFYKHVSKIWPTALELNQDYKLVTIYRDRIEGIN